MSYLSKYIKKNYVIADEQKLKYVGVAIPSANPNHKPHVMILKSGDESAAQKEAKKEAENRNLTGFDLYVARLKLVGSV